MSILRPGIPTPNLVRLWLKVDGMVSCLSDNPIAAVVVAIYVLSAYAKSSKVLSSSVLQAVNAEMESADGELAIFKSGRATPESDMWIKDMQSLRPEGGRHEPCR